MLDTGDLPLRFCNRCVYPSNHPLLLTFDDEGVCSGCRVHEEKDELDWAERLQRVRAIADEYRSHSRTTHDCIVPVSGARDSYFIVDLVKNVLGLNPLLVTYNKHYNTRVGIRNLAYLRSLIGCDIMTMTASPERVKRITRETLRLRGSIYWHCLAGQTAFPVQIAVKFRIPLIIWGAHQGVDQVGMFSHLHEVEMTRKYRKDHDLMGLEAEDLLANSTTLSEADIAPFSYPHDKELEVVGVRGIYLNNYVRWDSKAQHERMIDCYDYEPFPQVRTFDTYNDVDCFHYSSLHDYIKYIKWGYGKVSDHACREIRLKRMTRERGIELVRQYRPIKPSDTSLFLEWLEIQEGRFWKLIEQHRNQEAWVEGSPGEWILQEDLSISNDTAAVDRVRLPVIEGCEFRSGPQKLEGEVEDQYVLIGRGWADSHSLRGEP